MPKQSRLTLAYMQLLIVDEVVDIAKTGAFSACKFVPKPALVFCHGQHDIQKLHNLLVRSSKLQAVVVWIISAEGPVQ